MKCGAKKKDGGQCGRLALKGSSRCALHGGKSLKGIASPLFKHGRYSKYMPQRLMDRYLDALKDPELLAMRDDISLVDARMADLLQRVDTGEAGKTWAELRGAYKALISFMKANDGAGVKASLDDMSALIHKGYGDYVAWNEVMGAMEQRRKMVESERKRLLEMQQVITVEDTLGLMMRIIDAIKRNITDRETLNRISRELTAILSTGAGQTDIAGLQSGLGDFSEPEREPVDIGAFSDTGDGRQQDAA